MKKSGVKKKERKERIERLSVTRLMQHIDQDDKPDHDPDTIPTGFRSVDQVLGGGMRLRDLVVLGGDVGSGKSALALGIALRSAAAGNRVAFFSGEMDEDRLLERAMAIEGRTDVDSIRAASVSEEVRSAIGALALRLQELPLQIHPMVGRQFDEVLAPAWDYMPKLVVVDYLQLLPAPSDRLTQEEDNAASIRALKAMALERQVACLLVAQLPHHDKDRADPRPTLDDFGAKASVKQHADVVMGLFREDMYDPSPDLQGATELIVSKNRNGPTGYIDLYFYKRWMRFEDMLDPDR